MTNPVSWGAARAASTYQTETAVVRVDGASLTRERSYDRTLLRFAARGERLIADAGYELSGVNAMLLDQHGEIVARRSHESNRQFLLGATCTWAHEFYEEQLAIAASIASESEARLTTRRPLFTTALAAMELDADSRQLWRCTSAPTASDRLLRLSIGTFYNRGDLELLLMGSTAAVHDGHSNDLELNLRDGDGEVIATRWGRLSIGSSAIGYGDTSIRLEPRIGRAVRSLELIVRSEVRTINRIGPLLLKEPPALAPVRAPRAKAAPPKAPKKRAVAATKPQRKS